MTTAPIAVGGSYQQLASPLCDRIAQVALDQFRRWRPGGGTALVETSPAASPILREYYRVGIGTTVTDADMQSTVYQDGHPWSAVFISYVMRTAGAGAAFAYSAAHQTYIRAARQNRLSGNSANPFWAFRATEVAPRRRGPGVRVADEQRRDLRQHRRSPVPGHALRRGGRDAARPDPGDRRERQPDRRREVAADAARRLPEPGRCSEHVLRGDPLRVRRRGPARARRPRPPCRGRARACCGSWSCS